VLALVVFQAITGAQTPACLFAASNSVETVTPPLAGGNRVLNRKGYRLYFTPVLRGLVVDASYSPETARAEFEIGFAADATLCKSIDSNSLRSMPSRICVGVLPCLVIT
jgi:hypothetical protein